MKWIAVIKEDLKIAGKTQDGKIFGQKVWDLKIGQTKNPRRIGLT